MTHKIVELTEADLEQVRGGAKKTAKKTETKPKGNSSGSYLQVTFSDALVSS